MRYNKRDEIVSDYIKNVNDSRTFDIGDIFVFDKAYKSEIRRSRVKKGTTFIIIDKNISDWHLVNYVVKMNDEIKDFSHNFINAQIQYGVIRKEN